MHDPNQLVFSQERLDHLRGCYFNAHLDDQDRLGLFLYHRETEASQKHPKVVWPLFYHELSKTLEVLPLEVMMGQAAPSLQFSMSPRQMEEKFGGGFFPVLLEWVRQAKLEMVEVEGDFHWMLQPPADVWRVWTLMCGKHLRLAMEALAQILSECFPHATQTLGHWFRGEHGWQLEHGTTQACRGSVES